MKTNLLNREVTSPALREVIIKLNSIIDRVEKREIIYQQGSTEISGCKYILQSIALDWAFNNRRMKDATKNIE